MIRRLFTVTAVISLSLCVATAVLWARSYSRMDRISFEVSGTRGEYTASRDWFVTSFCGGIGFTLERYAADDADQPFVVTGRHFHFESTDARDVIDTDAPDERWRFQRYSVWAGFGYWRMPHGDADTRGIAIPHWLFVVLLIALPSRMAVREYRTRSRRRHGHCSCGYDLRATPDRCPECGSPVSAKS